MALPDLAVRRPVTMLMATAATAVFGLLAAGRLPVELLPDLSYPTLTIQTRYTDAAPVSVEQFVTRPVEEAVGVIPGVRDMRSISRAGLSEVILEFEWNEDMDLAALDVREKLGLVTLPRDVEPPRVLRYDPSLDPILRLALDSRKSSDELRQVAERVIKPRLESVRGVAAAKVRGGLDPEIQVEADEDRLAALGLTLDDLGRALRAENINNPGGTLKDWGAVYLVRTLHEFTSLSQIRQTVVRESPEGRVRVEDVATVTRGFKDREELTRSGGLETVEIALHREGSANTLVVAEAIRSTLDVLREELSGEVSFQIANDQSRYIGAAVNQVWSAAAIGGVLAVLVLYFFLRDIRATVIIALTIPTSVVATFLPMHQAGVTLNIMSLGGLALGVGMLVDNSIVVLEAIDRRFREEKDRRRAAVRGALDVASAVTAATLTTVSVFLPIVFVQGIAGQLFYDLAVTVCLSLVASLLVSLTLIPSLASLNPTGWKELAGQTLFRWDKGSADSRPWTFRLGGWSLPPMGDGQHWFSRVLTVLLFLPRVLLLSVVLMAGAVAWVILFVFHQVAWPLAKGLDFVGTRYPRVVRGALRFRFLVIASVAALLGGSLVAVPGLGTQLVPSLSQGEFAFRLTFPEGTPLESSAQVVERIERPLVSDPRFDRVFSVVGSLPSSASGRQTLGENLAQINFVLPEGTQAEREAEALERVRSVLALFPNVEAELVRPSVLSLRPPVEIKVFADELNRLEEGASRLMNALATVPGIVDITTTAEPGSPEIRIELDRERAAALGLGAEQIGQSMRRQIRGDVVGEFREAEERWDIRLRASETSRNRASDVQSLRVMLDDGSVIPISAVADVVTDRGPAAIHRAGGGRVARVTAESEATDLGLALQAIADVVRETELPDGVMAEMGGQDEELSVSFDSLKLAIALAIFLVFVVMAMQFESLVHPFVILLSVPMGMIGVIFALWVTKTTISVLALIGVVMLAGIVVNNAIVLVDAINRRRRQGEDLDSAIVSAGRERLRPILMTTTTTVLALCPMALGLGAGDELRAPMAITVIGGLLVSSVLTLVVIPCVYRILSRTGGASVHIEESGSLASSG